MNKRLEDLASDLEVVITGLTTESEGKGLTHEKIREKIKPHIDRIQELMQDRFVESGHLEAFLKNVNRRVILPGHDKEGHPIEYVIDFDIEVTPKGYLEIKPGARLHFTEQGGVLCYGVLKAGDPDDARPITFTAADSAWKNITLAGSFADTSYMHHCIIRNGTGRSVVPGRTWFADLNEGKPMGGGLLIVRSSPHIRYCTFQSNRAQIGSDLFVFGSNATIELCRFEGGNERPWQIRDSRISQANNVVNSYYRQLE